MEMLGGDVMEIGKAKFLEDLKKMLETDEELTMDIDLLDIDAWDSFSMMNFIAMVEENYGFIIETHLLAEAVLVEDLFDIVKKCEGRK